MPALQAVLWDMDGTLVDSEKVWAEVQLELLAELGATWTLEDCLTLSAATCGTLCRSGWRGSRRA